MSHKSRNHHAGDHANTRAREAPRLETGGSGRVASATAGDADVPSSFALTWLSLGVSAPQCGADITPAASARGSQCVHILFT